MIAGLSHWLPALAWAAFIFFLSHQSEPPGSGLGPDYVGHFLLYGVLSLTLVWGMTRGWKATLTVPAIFVIWSIATVYGALDEWHQSFVPGRTSSWSDLMVDSLAALLLAAAIFYFLRRRRRTTSRLFEPRRGAGQ